MLLFHFIWQLSVLKSLATGFNFPPRKKTKQSLPAETPYPKIKARSNDTESTSTGLIFGTQALAVVTSAPPPTPTCTHLQADPDKGRANGGCVCDSSVTLPILTSNQPKDAKNLDEQFCGYTVLPTSGGDDPITTESWVWTSNCQACTLIGGFAASKTCTPVEERCTSTPTVLPKPTIAAWVSNQSTIDLGNAADKNNGTDLTKDLFNQLSSFCDDHSCDTQKSATVDKAETIINKEEEPVKPVLSIQGAQYENITIFNQMLSVGLSTWMSAMNDPTLSLCNDVVYTAHADPTESGCGDGPIEPSRLVRIVRRHDGKTLWARDEVQERCFDSCGGGGFGNEGGPLCSYHARVCHAPNEITAVAANAHNPYANHLNIGVTIEKDSPGDGFDCEAVAGLLTAATVVLAPELLPADALEGIEIESICGVIENPESAVDSLGGFTSF